VNWIETAIIRVPLSHFTGHAFGTLLC